MGIQVRNATYDGQGNLLPIIDRQFISFNYGGRDIEEFGLLVIFESGRLSKNIYTSFHDITTNIEGRDGQFYWGSYYDADTLSFTLATDGITTSQYEDFKNYFVPGIARDFILSEFANRTRKARVQTSPQINLLPFEDKIKVKVGGIEQEIRTSLYKGEITLEFVFDDPFWAAKDTYFDTITEDNVKIFHEDGIPIISAFDEDGEQDILLADGKYYKYTTQQIVEQTNLIGSQQYYYCGTAPIKPQVSFTIQVELNGNNSLVTLPKNSYAQTNEYSWIKIANDYLYYTTPSILTNYNLVNTIINSYSIGDSIVDLMNEVREKCTHYYCRAWSMAILRSFMNDPSYTYCSIDGELLEGFEAQFYSLMKYFILNEDLESELSIIVNYNNGSARMRIKCRTASSALLLTEGAALMENFIEIEEDAGDMIRSPFPIINDRSILDENGFITSDICFGLSFDASVYNIKMNYEYLYM